MKLQQLHNYIIKNLIKKEKYVYDEDEKNIYFTEGYTIYIVSKDDNFIDLDKVKQMNLTDLYKKFNLEEAELVENLSVLLNNNSKKKIIKGVCDGKEFYFYEERLKYFDKNYKLYKMENNPLYPIYVTEEEILKGVIMPMRFVEE